MESKLTMLIAGAPSDIPVSALNGSNQQTNKLYTSNKQ